MASQQRHGHLCAIDRQIGGVSFKLNVANSDVSAADRVYKYSGPNHPFRLAERIYANDGELIERLQSDGFTVAAHS